MKPNNPIVYLLLVFIICACKSIHIGEIKPDPNFHLYLLVGQSNMAGRGRIDSLSTPNNPRILILTKENEWIIAKDPLHFDKPKVVGVGPGLAFAQEMLVFENNRNVKIGLIPCAVGGTNIDMWQPGKDAYDGQYYPYDDAIKQLHTAMKEGVIKGIIWHQGEGDSNEEKAKVYIEKLERLITLFRNEIGDQEVPFVAGELGYYRENYMLINKELEKLSGIVPLTSVATSEGLVHNGDSTHLDSESARKLGRRMAIEMRALQSSKWFSIAPYMHPPKEYEYRFHGYRTPLQFYDGTVVKNKDDWNKRREEIRSRWMEMMGEWPPIIKGQQFNIVESTRREDFTQQRVRFFWTPNEETEGYLLIPDTPGKKPAVITVYYEPETAVGIGGKPYRDFAYQLVKRGFVTLSIGTAETTLDKTYSIYYPDRENAVIQPLSTLAYAAANTLEVLSGIEGVNPDKIGIVGHSYGGKWAMFASCLYEKFAATVWIDPGIVFDGAKGPAVNYWEPWYLGYYPPPWENTWSKTDINAKGLYPKLRKEGYDLHELHVLMAPRPFFVSGGSSDPIERWIPLNHTIAVNKLLGYNHRVGMSNRPEHSPNAESNEIIYSFFEWFLK